MNLEKANEIMQFIVDNQKVIMAVLVIVATAAGTTAAAFRHAYKKTVVKHRDTIGALATVVKGIEDVESTRGPVKTRVKRLHKMARTGVRDTLTDMVEKFDNKKWRRK